eukprot:8970251-Pyramimonas_sp.AAC.1
MAPELHHGLRLAGFPAQLQVTLVEDTQQRLHQDVHGGSEGLRRRCGQHDALVIDEGDVEHVLKIVVGAVGWQPARPAWHAELQ